MGPTAGLDALKNWRILFSLPEIEARFLGNPARSLVTIPSMLKYYVRNQSKDTYHATEWHKKCVQDFERKAGLVEATRKM